MNLAVAVMGLFVGAVSTSAQVGDLEIEESGDDVSLNWGSGTAPYRVLRSTSPDFYFGNRVVADDVVTSSTQDPGALRLGNHSYFYDVLEDGEEEPPGVALNPPAAAPPTITDISPASGQPGDMVTISGNGFIADGSRMIVTFHHAIAELVTVSETALQVVVPTGAYTGDVLVCIASDICSNPLPFEVTYGASFQDISSIAYETGTGSLWVADRGTVDDVVEIDATGAAAVRGSLAQAMLGHPSPSDGSGRIYYCNSVASDFNVGSIEYIDSSTNGEVFFDTAGRSGGTDTAVRCEGIAANDAEPDVAYFLDGRGNTVRRIVRDALAHDLEYGDQPFSFNSPSGARFDSAGNLYLSSTTAIYRILPGESAVELVASGFTAAAGIDLVELGGETILAVADEASGTVWLVNATSGLKLQAKTGMAGPIAVAFSDDPLIGKTGLYVAEPTRILRLPDPRLEFKVKVDQRILLSKSWSFDVFPSSYQSDDGEIAVEVKLNPIFDPTGKSAYFRLMDPKDPSGYIQDAGIGDNLPTTPAGSLTTQATFDINGVATTTLSVNNQHSGNNYRIEASLADGADFRALAISPVYTTWRRGYIEHDFMWRSGAWVIADSGAGQPNPMRVFVSDPSVFSIGDDVQILSGDSFETANGEFGVVAALGATYVDVDTDFGAGQAGLKNLYRSAQAPPPDDQLPFSFLAKILGGVYDSSPDTGSLAIAFDDAFAEWTVLPTGGFVPFWPQVPDIDEDPGYIPPRSTPFFNSRTAQGRPSIMNTVHLVSAASAVGSLGLTLPQGENSNWSWIFNATIADLYPSATQPAKVAVAAHELAHQYNVNQGDPGAHDTEDAWAPAGQACLMNLSRDWTLGVGKMHAPGGVSTNDLMCIRTHIDDLDNSIACSIP